MAESKDNHKQTIVTPFGNFEIGPMAVSELYRGKLIKLLQEEFEASFQHNDAKELRSRSELIVHIWDKLRQ